MASIEKGLPGQWEEFAHRETYYGLDITLRRNQDSGVLAAIVLSAEGVSEISQSTDAAMDAYFHPASTPGLNPEAVAVDPWDEALDAYNGLSPRARYIAMSRFNRTRKGSVAAPILLLEAAKKVSEIKGLDRAA